MELNLVFEKLLKNDRERLSSVKESFWTKYSTLMILVMLRVGVGCIQEPSPGIWRPAVRVDKKIVGTVLAEPLFTRTLRRLQV